MDADSAERRRQVLEALKFERQQARAAVVSASPVEDQHNALMQKLLSERQGSSRIAPARFAWEEHIDRQASKLQMELGLFDNSEPNSSHHADTLHAALEADALDIGGLGKTELDAVGQQAAAELDQLGARGASALASAVHEAHFSGATRTQHGQPQAASTLSGSYGSTGSGVGRRDGDCVAPHNPPPPPPPAAATATISGSSIPSPSPKVKPGRATTASAAMAVDARIDASAVGASSGCEAYTFQPKINSRSSKLAEKRDGSCTSRLSSQRAEAYAKREIQRMDMERERFEDCTFTPRINAPRAGGSKKSSGGPDRGADSGNRRLSAGERLHYDADRKAEMLERKRVASERWEVSSHRFQPHINPTSSMIASEGGQAPLHERVEEMLRKKEVHLHTIRVRVEGEQAATFAPSINPISSAIAAAVYSEKASSMPLDCGGRLGHTASGTAFSTAAPDVVERLSAEASLVLERRAQRELQRREAEVQQCPFKPQVNGLSDRIADQVNASGGGHKGTVFTGLQEKAKEAEARKKQREAQALEEESATFKSTASEANGILLAARSARLNESHLERTERLAYVDSKRKEAIKQQLQVPRS